VFDFIVALIPGLPLVAALGNGVNALIGERYSWRVVQRVASGSLFLSLLGCLWVFSQVLLDPTPREVVLYRWLVSGNLTVDVAFLIDSLSATMMLVTTSISFLIAIFSINYMHNERGFSRYFTVMPLFVFAMLVLVMGNSYILLFLGWEGVGVCSYLLIGFYYDRKAAVQAGTKAFVMNRVGDAGFLMGIFLIIDNLGTANYTPAFAGATALDTATATAIGLCLLLGAIGKSAQLPLVTWLARAMEGPTPSSALIHAATMVTAGVYMIARSHAIYDRAPDALLVVAVVGAATTLYGAVVGLVQTDIKSLLAYSTTSQLGLMFLACGLGAYAVAIFHLAAHAVFKTLLFLTAPSILHHLHGGADVRETAPARETIPRVHLLVLVSAVALAVFPFLSGWWQGQVIGRAFTSGLPILAALGLLAVFSAALSTGRLVKLTFGEHTHGEHAHGVHEPTNRRAPGVVVTALLVLTAIVAIGLALGVLPGGVQGDWFERFLAPVVAASPGIPAGSPLLASVLMGLIVLMLVTGWFIPLYFERFKPERPGLFLFRFRRVYNFAVNRFWLDELYDVAVVQPAKRLGRLLDRLDSEVIDRATGVPGAPRRVHVTAPTWEEQRLASQALGAAGLAGELTPLEVTWREEEREEKAAAAEDVGGVFGWVAKVGGETTGWVEREGIGHASGVFGWLTRASADTGGWIEREGVGRVGGAFSWLARVIGSLTAWVEREIINGGEDLVSSLTRGIAGLSARVERSVFQTGVHIGVPKATDRIGRFLNATEEILGRPVVIGSLVFLSFVALLLTTL